MMNADRYDVLVIGAGPAGMAAACTAAEAGSRVVVVDAAGSPGGQFWRNADAGPRLHHRHGAYRRLRARATTAGVRLAAEHTVQTVRADADGFTLACAVGAEPRTAQELTTLRGHRLIIAIGAYDRQMPFPGWDLPGVLAAGGVQALLKAHGVRAGARVVVAGTGPLLLPVADALIRSGARVPAILDANSPTGFARHPAALAGSIGKLGEAAGYAARLALARTPYPRRQAVVAALGDERIEAVRVARLDRAGMPVDGPLRTIDCDALAVGWGFTPQLELPLQLGCATAVGSDGSLVVRVDADQRTSVPDVWAAGEATGIGGSDLSLVEGEIAGRSAAAAVVPPSLPARRARLRRFADAVHAVHPVPEFLLARLPSSTLVCRCEEVDAAEIREAVRDWGATDAKTVKRLARPGMGWCQGRVCGYATAHLTARLCGREVTEADLRAFAERPFAVPLPLRAFTADDESE